MFAHFKQGNKWLKAGTISLSLVWAGTAVGQTMGIPPATFGRLGSDNFADREAAQAELTAWARKDPERSILELHKQSRHANDPEVRQRCLSALRDLVVGQEYRGDGYLGVGMEEVETEIPGDPKLRRAIRVTEVKDGTGASRAGLMPGDLIVSLNERIWRDAGMFDEFPKTIRGTKPGTEIKLQLLRDGKLLAKAVTLGEKPEGYRSPADGDLEQANREAKDRFFQRWLDKREAGAR